jgi:hypothetical protein
MSYHRLIRPSKWALNFIVPFIAVGFGRELIVIISHASIASTRWPSVLIGGAVFVPLWAVARRQIPVAVEYLATLEHELTHIVVALLFLKRPLSLRVTAREGGEVMLTGGNLWITLAPYFLPSTTFLLLPVGLLLGREHQPLLLAAIGATVSYHILSTWSEMRIVQSDFRKAGILQSLWLLPVANLVLYGSVGAYVANSFDGFSHFWRAGGANTLTLLSAFVHYGISLSSKVL